MKSKRFLLALIAASMSLAGCGKKDKDNTPAEDTPASDPSGGDPSGGDPSGGDEDELTPEQRENAGQIQNIMKMTLGYVGQYEEETVTSIDEFTLTYSEEIALEDVSFAAVGSALAAALSLDTSDPKAIVDFVVGLQDSESLDDVVYFAVALGKSFLRAEGKANEEYSEVFEYVADYLDEEKVDLHKNVYGLLDSVVGCAGLLASEGFVEAAGKVYNAEENQLNFEGISGVLTTVGGALTAFTASYENASYLANLVVDGVTGFVDKFFPEELEEETRALKLKEEEEEFGVQDIIDGLYQTVAVAGYGLQMLAMDGSPAEHVVDLVNLVLAENYMDLALVLFGDFNKLIGIEESEWKTGIGSLVGVFFTAYSTVKGVIKTLSGNFVDEKTGKFSADLLKDAFAACSEQIQFFGSMSDLALEFDEYLVKVVNNVLIVFGGYEEEAAKEVAAQFDVSEQIKKVYGVITYVGEIVGGVHEDIFEIVADIMNGKYADAISKFFEFIGSEVEFEAVQADVQTIQEAALTLYAEFTSEEFLTKVYAVVAAEDDAARVAKVKEIVLAATAIVRDFLDVEVNVKNIGDAAVDVVKKTLHTLGMTDEMIAKIFEGFEVNSFVESVFTEVSDFLDMVDGLVSLNDYDVYFRQVAKVICALLEEEKTPATVPYAVIEAVCAVLSAYFGIDSEKMESLEFSLKSPYIIEGIIEMIGSASEGTPFIDYIISVDPETGVSTINKAGLNTLCTYASLAFGIVSGLLEYYANSVDIIEEIVGKITDSYNPEAEEDPESVYAQIKGALLSAKGAVDSARAVLSNTELLNSYLDMIEAYGNIVLEGIEIFGAEEVDGYDVAKYIVKVATMFVDTNIYTITITEAAALDLHPYVKEAIGYEEFEGVDGTYEGKGFAFSEVSEDDGVYSVDIYFVDSYRVVIEDGEISELAISGEVYQVTLPSLEFVANYIASALSEAQGLTDVVYPYIDSAAEEFDAFYEIYSAYLAEYEVNPIPEVEAIKALFANEAELPKALLAHVLASLSEVFEGFRGGAEADIDFSLFVYSLLFNGEPYALSDISEERFDSVKLALADVYEIAEATGSLERLLEALAVYLGEGISEVESGEEFVAYIFEVIFPSEPVLLP